MSSQSGIVADKALLDSINNVDGRDGVAIITANISTDSTAVTKGDTFHTLEQLQRSLGSEPLYILVKDLKKGNVPYIFVSYVPDASPVRAKMLYASTKNTLVRQIGSNSIGKQLLFTEPSEIKDILEEKDSVENGVLSESERANLEIAQQQQRMKLSQHYPSGRKLVSQTNGTPKQLAFDVSSNGMPISSLFKENNVVSFKIDLASEEIEVASTAKIGSPSELHISTEHPSYTLYKNGSLFYFIYSCPSGSKVKDRMVYASNRSGFVSHLTDDEKIAFAKVIEIGEPSELELSLISSSSEDEQRQKEALENSSIKPKFNRPSGPGRRSKKSSLP